MYRMKNLFRYIIYLFPFLAFHSCRSQQKEALPVKNDNNTLLWEISGKNLRKPSYLFGTFHILCKENIRFSDNLKKALADSRELYCEMDLDDPANTLGALFFINMKEGKTLKDLYSPEEYQRLESFFRDSLQMGLSTLQRMKPTFLEAMLYPKMLNCRNMSGVEEELLMLAQKDKKPVAGFETIAFQSSVFDSIPYETQAKALLRSIDSIDQYKSQFDSMVHIYKMQQLSAMEKLLESEPGFEESREVMLDNRNKNWVIQLKTILPKKNIFIAVGAGHLVGANGMIELLRKEGYTVKPIDN